MAKKETFNDKEVTELKKLLVEKREELRQFRFAQTGARGKDAHAGARTRKDIARILTALTVKNLPTGQAGLPAGKAGAA